MRAVSGVFVKIAAALVRPWRTSGLSAIVWLDRSRTVSVILAFRWKASRRDRGDVSPPPRGPTISGGPTKPRNVGARTPPQVR